MTDDPIALESYEQLADAYAALVDTKGHNAYYERPAMLSLLPDVDGLDVLDAACGPGRYAEWLADHGARVTAFDVSPQMLEHARRRLGERAHFLQADLNQPLVFQASESVDLVLCALALDYVRDWPAVFAEFARVLRASGQLVFSIEHPLSDYSLHQARDYFRTERVRYTWRGFGEPVVVHAYRRPLMDVFNGLSGAGFCVDRVVEPLPTDEFKAQDAEEYERLLERPGFLCVRARKVSASG
jgi:ubiquinone/menaquinone biosynthesis C-methylase UbiE